jgi:hypothetical protein
MAQDASLRQYIGAAQVYLSLMIQQISFTLYGDNNSPRFAYSSGHHLLICFTGAETEIPKIKDDSKIKRQKTSIAAVRDQFLSFATFPTPLLSRYRLPLSSIPN